MINVDGEDIRLNEVQRIVDLDLPVYIYGNGTYGGVLAEYLYEKGIDLPVTFVVDDIFFAGESNTISLSDFIDNYSDISVMVIGIYNYDVVRDFKNKYSRKIHHIFDFHMTSLGTKRVKWDRREVERRINLYNRTYEMLADADSKKTMLLYMRAAINGEFDKLYVNCFSPIPYFNDFTGELQIDTLIDCGSYDGDSIHDFVNVFPRYDNIFAIEPDSLNREQLFDRIAVESIPDVTVIPFGVYGESGTLHFSEDGTSSAHVGESGKEIQVISIDDLVTQYCDSAENIFIKMDIEGVELDALKGAEKTIKTFHPCLSVCVYHKENDLIDIPAYIDSLVEHGTYKYKLGFHGKDLAELVFYAIPKSID